VTPDQLSAIRARLDAASVVRALMFVNMEASDLRALLDEVERLTTLLAGTEAVLENEREYQTRLKAEVGQLANESFRRGTEAMREAALAACWHHGAMYLHKQIGALPIPEDKHEPIPDKTP
jgi:hypothetical protein